MENNSKITCWFSTDGKLSVSFNAQDVKEADTLYKDAEALFRKMVALKNELGLVIASKGGFPPKKLAEKEWTGEKCPKDGGRLYKATTATGKKMIKCENSKWNAVTKQNIGCNFIEWIEDDLQKKFEQEVRTVVQEVDGVKMATLAQINLIKKLQGEGRISELIIAKDLTLDKAKELISSSINK